MNQICEFDRTDGVKGTLKLGTSSTLYNRRYHLEHSQLKWFSAHFFSATKCFWVQFATTFE